MDKQEILKEAMALQPELVNDRRQLHQHPEIAFDLTYTKEFVWKKLVLFAIPLLLGNLFQQLYSAVDSLVVGNFCGNEALAATTGFRKRMW